jgi:hypothetical protein
MKPQHFSHPQPPVMSFEKYIMIKNQKESSKVFGNTKFTCTEDISDSSVFRKSDANIVFLTQHCLPWMQSMNGVYYANTVKTH